MSGISYLGSDLRQNQMNSSARDIVAPCLVEVAKGLRLEFGNACCDVCVLCVVSCAALLDLRAQSGCGSPLDQDIVEVDTRACLCPCLKVGDPGIIFQDKAIGVKVPEGDLTNQVSWTF